MKDQVVFVSRKGVKVVVDKHSDPRNVKLFNEVLSKEKGKEVKTNWHLIIKS